MRLNATFVGRLKLKDKVQLRDKDKQLRPACIVETLPAATWIRNNKYACSFSATCRRPIKGAADRPMRSGELWKESLLFSPNTTQIASDVERRLTHRLASMPSSTAAINSSAHSRPAFTAPPAGQTKAANHSAFPWVKLLLLALLAALIFFIYQTMEPNSISPFQVAAVGRASDGNA